MSKLLLVFLTALHVNSLLLMALADAPLGRPIMGGKGLQGFAGLALVAAWLVLAGAPRPPATIQAYLLALCFSSVLLAYAGSIANGLPKSIPTRLRQLRALLPLAVAIAATASLATVQASGRLGLGEVLLLCGAASALVLAAMVVTPALRERLDASDPPALLRGAAIDILCAALLALAGTGIARLLPW